MSGRIESYKDLIVWQQAVQLAVATYALTRAWPKDEMYGLTSQARRAVTSVAANIAEGYGRESRGSYQQFLRMAQGSLKEFETHLVIAERAGIADATGIKPLLDQAEEVGKMLRNLIRKLEPS